MNGRRSAIVVAAVAVVIELLTLLPRGGSLAQPVGQQATLRVATWNICAEFAECPAVADASGRVNAVVRLINDHDLDVVLLQETCEWHVSRVLTSLGSGWTAAFSPWRQNDAEGGWPGRRIRACGGDRQALGLAIVMRGAHDQSVTHTLPSPTARYSLEAPLLCVRKASPAVRLCNTHFTPAAYDPTGSIRTAQRTRAVEVLRSFGGGKVILGGDLNLLPPSGSFTPPGTTLGARHTTLNGLYDVLRECDQTDGLALTGAPRAGESTTFWGSAGAPTWGRLDYLFATPSAADQAATFSSCDALDGVAAYRRYSDHLPVVGVVQL
jgi:endonuclease/exonuclease/phosphatase family metal-dependent hydrolase